MGWCASASRSVEPDVVDFHPELLSGLAPTEKLHLGEVIARPGDATRRFASFTSFTSFASCTSLASLESGKRHFDPSPLGTRRYRSGPPAGCRRDGELVSPIAANFEAHAMKCPRVDRLDRPAAQRNDHAGKGFRFDGHFGRDAQRVAARRAIDDLTDFDGSVQSSIGIVGPQGVEA